MPAISDYTGRRYTSVASFALAFLTLYIFIHTGAHPGLLFALLFGVSFFSMSIIALLSGPVAVESVPPRLHSTAIGIISGTGEIFGGLGTIAAGYIANHYAIQNVPIFSLVAVGIGAIVCVALRETSPRRLRARS